MDSEQRNKILEAFKDLRVTDVRDGMDCLGLHFQGSMIPAIRPLFRTRAFGIARTVQYIPFQGVIPKVEPDEYFDWAGKYYGEICTYQFIDEVEDGDFIVIDQSSLNIGLMGSDNTLTCMKKGARGFVSNGGVRDTDEIILQKVPFWSLLCSQTMVQGRLQYKDRNCPVSVGDVTVNPGDIIVADGDGVISVPQEHASEVARLAHAEHDRDKKRRAKHYKDLGMEDDGTI